MSKKDPLILVTGGTGTLGRHVVARLRDAGRDVRVLSRNSHVSEKGAEYVIGDLQSGFGVEAAVQGAEVIVHCAGGRKGDDQTTGNLTRAASRASAKHLVFISVVGVDQIPTDDGVDRTMFGYFGSKLAAERVVVGSGIPWTTLRATQFHDLLLTVAQQITRLPVIPVPSGVRFQPIDAREVAERLAELALDSPAGLVPDVGGPRIESVADLLRAYLQARGMQKKMASVWLPGAGARALRAGANLTPDRAVGRITWEEFLAERIGSTREATQHEMAA